MPTAVCFQTSRGPVEAVLNDNPIATALSRRCPMTATVMRWGEEIYFDVPVKLTNTHPTVEVKVGDIAYWPDGPCLCIFFGKTPASKGNEPRPASDVTIIGHTDAPVSFLRSIEAGTTITLDRVSSSRPARLRNA